MARSLFHFNKNKTKQNKTKQTNKQNKTKQTNKQNKTNKNKQYKYRF